MVQVPFNLQMREAAESHTQEVKDELMSLLGAAAHFGLQVTACGALQQVGHSEMFRNVQKCSEMFRNNQK